MGKLKIKLELACVIALFGLLLLFCAIGQLFAKLGLVDPDDVSLGVE